MGFRDGAYATVWEILPKSDKVTRARISTSRKNKETGEYRTDFSGYVSFVGADTAQRARSLQRMSRIKISGCDVTSTYDKEKKITYVNYTIFGFEDVPGRSGANVVQSAAAANATPTPEAAATEGEPPDLPF